MARSGKKKLDTTVLVAIIGLIGTLVAGLLSSPVLIKLLERTPAPLETVTPGTTAGVPIDRLQQVFSADFEEGKTSGFGFDMGDWVVEKDKSNRVLQGTATSDITPAGKAYFGPNDFSDGIIEFRFRFKTMTAGLYFDFRLEYDKGSYVLYLDPINHNIVLATNMLVKDDWQFAEVAPGTSRSFTFEQDTWYRARIEAQGEKLSISIDGNQILSATDARLKKGQIRFAFDPEAIVQFDDVKVWIYR